MTYKDFVKTTFAYNRDMDLIHCTLGLLGEFIELRNEYLKYLEVKVKAEDRFKIIIDSDPEYQHLHHRLQETRAAVDKELGDIAYYATMAGNILESCYPNYREHLDGYLPQCFTFEDAIEEWQDVIKRKFFYKHEIHPSLLIRAASDLVHTFETLCQAHDTTSTYVINLNELKLRRRYPEGTFNAVHAAQKLDK